MGRISELDSLRGFAALAVVLYHYTTQYDHLFGRESPFMFKFSYGNLGVQLFFIISGFVIFMTLEKTSNLVDFIYKRISRLYPAYIFAVILTFFVTKLFNFQGQMVSFGDAIINLTMFQRFLGVPDVDGVYWTLSIELVFYFFMGLLILFKFKEKVQYVSILWLIIGAIIQFIALKHTMKGIGWLNLVFISEYCNLFIAGIMFFLVKKQMKPIYHLIILMCLVYQFAFSSLIVSITVLAFFVLFYMLIYGKMNFLNLKPFVFLGEISYSLYLIHQNIGYVIIYELEKSSFVHGIYIIIPIFVSILLAYFITRFIEKPTQKFLKNKKYIVGG